MNAVMIPDVESDDPYAVYISCCETYTRIHDLTASLFVTVTF